MRRRDGLVRPNRDAQVQQQPAQSQVHDDHDCGPESDEPKIPDDQLDSLVAPIALYPDPLLAQTLAASTYPLEIIQLQQWMQKNKNLKDKALTDAVAKQPWDPSVQSMAACPGSRDTHWPTTSNGRPIWGTPFSRSSRM